MPGTVVIPSYWPPYSLSGQIVSENRETDLFSIDQTVVGDEFYCYSHPDILFEAFSTLRPVGLTEGEMLVKVLKIKDFYEFSFCSNTIVSMCSVLGNMSTGWTCPSSYPFSCIMRTSLASVAGSQET